MSSETYVSPATLIKIIKEYFPVTLTDSIRSICEDCPTNGCSIGGDDHSQQWLRRVHEKTGFFETPAELEEALLSYRNFPASHEELDADFCDGYSTTPVVVENIKGETFISRNDVFVFLQNMVIADFPYLDDPLSRALLAVFLKAHEKLIVTNSCEFIRWSDDVHAAIEKQFVADARIELRTRRFTPAEYISFEEMLASYQQFIPVRWDAERFRTIETLLENTLDTTAEPNWFTLQAILRALETMFMSPLLQPIDAKVVRIFEGDEYKFVLIAELDAGLSPQDPLLNWETCDVETAVQVAKGSAERVEFLRIPVARTRLRSTPIRLPNGRLAKISFDAFRELLHDVLFGLDVFQKVSVDHRKRIDAFADILKDHFPAGCATSPFLMTRERVDLLREVTRNMFAPAAHLPAKSLVGGQTMCLEEALTQLGIKKTFPQIQLPSSQRTEFQHDSQLLEAISDVVIRAVLINYPQLGKFYQRGLKPELESAEKKKKRTKLRMVVTRKIVKLKRVQWWRKCLMCGETKRFGRKRKLCQEQSEKIVEEVNEAPSSEPTGKPVEQSEQLVEEPLGERVVKDPVKDPVQDPAQELDEKAIKSAAKALRRDLNKQLIQMISVSPNVELREQLKKVLRRKLNSVPDDELNADIHKVPVKMTSKEIREIKAMIEGGKRVNAAAMDLGAELNRVPGPSTSGEASEPSRVSSKKSRKEASKDLEKDRKASKESRRKTRKEPEPVAEAVPVSEPVTTEPTEKVINFPKTNEIWGKIAKTEVPKAGFIVVGNQLKRAPRVDADIKSGRATDPVTRPLAQRTGCHVQRSQFEDVDELAEQLETSHIGPVSHESFNACEQVLTNLFSETRAMGSELAINRKKFDDIEKVLTRINEAGVEMSQVLARQRVIFNEEQHRLSEKRRLETLAREQRAREQRLLRQHSRGNFDFEQWVESETRLNPEFKPSRWDVLCARLADESARFDRQTEAASESTSAYLPPSHSTSPRAVRLPPLKPTEAPKVSLEATALIRDLKARRDDLVKENLGETARKLILDANYFIKNESVKTRLARELGDLFDSIRTYKEAIEANISMIQKNPTRTAFSLLPIPPRPRISASFYAQVHKAVEEETDSE